MSDVSAAPASAGDVNPSSLPLPPGSFGAPVLGETIAFLKDPYGFLEARYRRHGAVFKTRILNQPHAFFVGPDAIRWFYDEENVTRTGGSPPHFMTLLDRDAIPFLDGDAHEKRRALLRRGFTPEALAAYQRTIERIVARFVAAWSDGAVRTGVDELGKLAFTVAAALFVGADPDREDPAHAAVFDTFSEGLAAVPVNLPFTKFGKAVRARDQLRAWIAGAVEKYVPGSGDHLLERLVAARTDAGEALTADEIRIELVHFFFAAFAGLQVALVGLLRHLAVEDGLAARVRDEVRAAAPTGNVGDALPGLDLLARTTREVRRMNPIVPTTFFGVVKKDGVFDGKRIPKGWKCAAVLQSTMHDGKWFASPEKFDPDRYLRGEGQGEHYVAHGAGPWTGHRCAGEALADRIMAAFGAHVARDFAVELPAQDLAPKTRGLIVLPSDGLRFRLTKA